MILNKNEYAYKLLKENLFKNFMDDKFTEYIQVHSPKAYERAKLRSQSINERESQKKAKEYMRSQL